PVAPVDSKGLITAFPGMLRNLVELVIFSPKAKEKNPWSNLGQNDHLYSIVADFESLLPFPVFHFFGFRCAGSCKFLHAFVPPGRVRRINSLGCISQISAGNRTISCSWRLYGNCLSRVFDDFVWVGYWCESCAVPAGYPHDFDLHACRHFGIPPLSIPDGQSSR